MIVAAGLEEVADEFERTLGAGGAAFAATVDGELIVDLWGGAGWREDTIVPVFSGTKGLVAACLLLLLDRGEVDLDMPVHGDVRVRHVVSHTAGLPGLPGLSAAALLDGAARRAELAAAEPLWPPGARLAYHAFTYGWLCDEVIRRVDGRSTGRFFAEEVAAPLGLELWIGLPAAEEPRVALLTVAEGYAPVFHGDDPALLDLLYGTVPAEFPWNEASFHRAEIPAANGIGTARSLATLYGRLGELVSDETLRLARTELSRGICAVTGRPYAFGIGFELQTELRTLGPPGAALGHTGSGGSVHGAWPDERVGFSYAMSELRAEAVDDRARRVLAALHRAVS